MSWGAETTSGASAAGSGAGSAGSGMLSQAGVDMSSAPATVDAISPNGGYSIQTEPQSAFSGASGYEVAQDGTSAPTSVPVGGSFMDGKAMKGIEQFQKGGNQGLSETYKNFGNNPETYGAAYGLINKMAGPGKQPEPTPITTNISYQQPVNPYLSKRGR